MEGGHAIISIAVLLDPTCKRLTAVPSTFHTNFKRHLVGEAEAVQAELRAKHSGYVVRRPATGQL